jgi:hypothetical protein
LQKVAEKGKSLADVSGDVGKVFINATSGFANVHQTVWQHTIGGYQVLHKWLDDRRKAGRSLSPDDITHWLRVYAALAGHANADAAGGRAIDAHGGWPGAFSQNHPPPDAATLAGEQMAQKEQTKAHKKAARLQKRKLLTQAPRAPTAFLTLMTTWTLWPKHQEHPRAQKLRPPLPRQRVARRQPPQARPTTSPMHRPCAPCARCWRNRAPWPAPT